MAYCCGHWNPCDTNYSRYSNSGCGCEHRPRSYSIKSEAMRAIKKLKVFALFLAGLIFLQSCSAYKTPVNLEQAAGEEKAVKIITVDNETYKYKYILYEDGQFYGVKDNPGENVKFPIDTEEVAMVMIKKKGIPKWVIIVVGSLVVIGIIIWIAIENSDFGTSMTWG